MNSSISFIVDHPYLLSLVLFVFLIIFSSPTKRKKLISIALFAFPFAFVTAKILELSFQNPTKFVSSYLLPLFHYTVQTAFLENEILICLTVACVVFAEYARVGVLFALLALLLAYNSFTSGALQIIDIVGCLFIAIGVAFIANKIIEKYY